MGSLPLLLSDEPNIYAVALTGMVIVFFALTVLTLFLMALPKILVYVNKVFPPSEHGHGKAAAAKKPELGEDVVAALAFALLHHQKK